MQRLRDTKRGRGRAIRIAQSAADHQWSSKTLDQRETRCPHIAAVLGSLDGQPVEESAVVALDDGRCCGAVIPKL